MSGNRMSSLDISQYCSLAGTLGGQSASGRAAVMGSAWHSCCADDKDKDDWLMKLTPEECEEIQGWHKPEPLERGGAPVLCLEYKDAEKEATVCLDSDGEYCEEDDPDCISVGHLDMAWVVEIGDSKLAVVGDIKKSAFTVDGPDTLQLTAYALAWASKHKCDAYLTAIWAATEGRWIVGDVVHMMDAGEPMARVKHAAQNVSDRPTMGNHCSKCWGWQQCRAYTMKATYGLTGMEDGVEVTADSAAFLLTQAEAFIRVGELTKKRLKLYAEKNPISDGNGKVWKPIKVKGRESVMGVAKLRKALGKDAEKYISKGYETSTFRWVNEAKK